MKKLLLVVALACGCATTKEHAGAREVAIGGGFVAVGVVAATGTAIATATLLVQASNPPEGSPFGASGVLLRQAAPGLAIAAAVDVIMIAGGAGLMALGEATIDESRPVVTPVRQVPRQQAAPKAKKPEPEERTELPGGRLALVEDVDSTIVVVEGDFGQCTQAMFIIDGREAAIVPLKNGRFRLPRNLSLVSAQFASLNLCRATIDLSTEERTALDEATKVR